MHEPDVLLPDCRASECNQHRRRGDDHRAVGHARLRQTANEQGLVEQVADDPERADGQPITPRQRRGRVKCARKHTRRSILPGRSPPAGNPRSRHHDEERGGSDRQSQGVEGLRLKLAEGALDDGMVGAPDDRHQQEQPVENGDPGASGHERAVSRQLLCPAGILTADG
jgi:hypothetical protein